MCSNYRPVTRLDRLLAHHDALRAGLGAPPINRADLTAKLLEVAPLVLPFAQPVDGGWPVIVVDTEDVVGIAAVAAQVLHRAGAGPPALAPTPAR